jgi:anti-sigma-K factor RskA
MATEEHKQYEEDLAAYMLGALDDAEARQFERHLQSCAACRAEQRALAGAIEVLPSSVEQIEPPPELRERLMEKVRAEAAPATRPQRQPSRRRLLPGLSLRPALALGAAALIAVGVAGGWLLRGGGGETTTVAARPTAAAPPTVRGEIVKTKDGALIKVVGLPQRPRRVYEVWLRRRGSTTVQPSSLFEVRSNGTGSAGIPGNLHGVAEVMVSSEPEGGSSQPTTKPVLRATL